MDEYGNDHYMKRLWGALAPLSVAKEYLRGKFEWDFAYASHADDSGDDAEYACACGHRIFELCFIRNSITKAEMLVGNCCVKKFLGVDMKKVFSNLRAIKKNINASPNAEMVEYLVRKRQLEKHEADWLIATRRMRVSGVLYKRRGYNCDILRYFEYCAIREANKRKSRCGWRNRSGLKNTITRS